MLRIGIIGCGRILNAHLQGYKQLREQGIDDFRITRLCARKEEERADVQAAWRRAAAACPPVLDPATGDPLAAPHTYLSFQDDVDPAVYTDYRELIASGEVDAINDFTTLALHHEVGLAALEAGKHLLTQKPLAISVRAGKLLVDTARARGLTLGVFENVRQSTDVRAAAWAVRAGLIGEPQMALMGGLGGLWSPDKVVAETPWRHKKLLGGGGGSIDIGVHQMHWMRYVVGEVAAVSATAQTLRARAPAARPGRPGDRARAGRCRRHLPGHAALRARRAGPALVVVGHARRAARHPRRSGDPGQPWWHQGGELVLDDGRRLSLRKEFERALTDADRELFFRWACATPTPSSSSTGCGRLRAGPTPRPAAGKGCATLACAFAILESSALGLSRLRSTRYLTARSTPISARSTGTTS